MAVTADQVYGDSQWLRENPGLISKFSQILTQYGIVPDQATLAQYGLSSLFDPNISQAAQANPYSTAAQLRNRLSGALTNNATNANAHGALFSGAFQNMQDASGRSYQQDYSNAGAQELSGLLGVQGDQANLYNSIFGRLLSQPVAPDTTAYPQASQPAAIGAGLPVPQQPYNRTGPETPSAAWAPFTPAKPKARGGQAKAVGGFASRAL